MSARSTPSMASRPGGFVFVMVLLLMVVSVATIGWSIARTNAQSAVVAMQLDEYQRHHELLGVRAIVRDWITEPEVQQALTRLAQSGEPAYVLELPSGELVTLYVQDGQGTALARLDIPMAVAQRTLQVDILSRLPRNDPRFTRAFGPVKISLWSAPFEVLLAAARGNYALTNAMADLRKRPDLSKAEFLSGIRSAGFDGGEGQELLSILEFTPELWRINVELRSALRINRYTLLATVQGNVAQVLEWRALPEGTDFTDRPAVPQRSTSSGSTLTGGLRNAFRQLGTGGTGRQ